MSEIFKNPAVFITFLAIVAYSAHELAKYLTKRMRGRPLPADDTFLTAFGKAFGVNFTVSGGSYLSTVDRYCVETTDTRGRKVSFGNVGQFGLCQFSYIFGRTRREAQDRARECLSAKDATVLVEKVGVSEPIAFIESEVRDTCHDKYRLPGFSSIEELELKAKICGGIDQWKVN